MLRRLGGFFYDIRGSALIVALAIVTAAGIYGFGGFGALKSAGFTDPASEATRAQNAISAQLPYSTSDVIVLLHSDTLTVKDAPFEQAVTTMTANLKTQPQVASITSYYTTGSGTLVSNDSHSTFVSLVLANPAANSSKSAEYDAIAAKIIAPPLQVTQGGVVLANRQINTQIGKDLERAEIITFPLVLVLLILVFGSVVAAGLPLVIGVVAIAGAFALIRLLTLFTDVSVFAANVITMLGLGLAIDYGLFIVTRFREEMSHDPVDTRGAIQRTMATAGRTVLFSGLTVCVSLISLLLFPEYFLSSMGWGAIAAVAVAMLAALTVLPALLGLLGRRVNALAVRRQRDLVDVSEQRGAWYRLSQGVMRFPIPVAIVSIAILLALGSPILKISFASFSITDLPKSLPSRVVADKLANDFPHQSGADVTIFVQAPGNVLSAQNLSALDGYVHDLANLPHVTGAQSLVTVSPSLTLEQYQQLYSHPGTNAAIDDTAKRLANGGATRIDLTLDAADNTTTAINTVKTIHAFAPPLGFHILVDGQTAAQQDLFASLEATVPIALAIIIVAIFTLLFLMTGSIVIPLKAIVLNTLSLSATAGALVFIFQQGHLANVLQFEAAPIEITQVVLIFAMAFGLSMDYEVFLISRIKERYDATHNNELAVASGLQRTGGLITSAALLLAVVLAAFATSSVVSIKTIGVGLTIAVIMDATLVRALLVPATMRLLGRANWWAPAPLRWLWQRVGLSEGDAPEIAPATAADTPVPAPEKQPVS
jgi:trehalose monomycolate/heme transporter